MSRKNLKETEIAVRSRCLHTPFKGEAICEYQVENTRIPKISLAMVYEKKDIRILINEC